MELTFLFGRTYWMAGLAHDTAHFFKFLFILVLYTLAMTLYVSLLLSIPADDIYSRAYLINWMPSSELFTRVCIQERRCGDITERPIGFVSDVSSPILNVQGVSHHITTSTFGVPMSIVLLIRMRLTDGVLF